MVFPMSTPSLPKKPAATAKAVRPPDPLAELVETLAEVVADRVVAKLAERESVPPMPEKVPVWLSRPSESGTRRRRRSTDKNRTIEQTLRDAGLVKMGDPGYDELLRRYLVRKRAHEAEIAARARLRRAVRLLGKLVAAGGTERTKA